MGRRLYVGNLPYTTGEAELQELFSRAGTVESVRVMRDAATAEDLVQETFLRAWRSLDALRDDIAAKAWLATILRREHARLYERKPMPTTDITDLELSDDAPGPEHRGEDAVLRAAIAKLEPKYREPLVLQVLGGFSCAEVAAQLGVSESAVMTQVFRARQKLRALLDGKEPEAELHGLP